MSIPPISNYSFNEWDPNQNTPIQKEINIIIQQFMQQHGFSGSVTVVQNGESIFANGYGDATVGIPNGENTTFRWDSVSKIITTVAILQLYEKHKLSLDDPVTKFLPEYKDSIGLGGNPPVTIRSLLTMTSGIAELPAPPGPAAWQTHPPTLKEMMDYMASQPRENQGTWSYSNSSYNLLGAIVGRIAYPGAKDTAESFNRYLEKHIFEPAGMTTATAPWNAEGDTPEAHSHIYDDAGNPEEITTNHYPDWTIMRMGAGNINGSVLDFEKFDAALNSGQLITMKDLDLMQTQRFGGWDPGEHTINGHSFLAKGGQQDGEQSYYMRFPNGTMIFITANVSAKDYQDPQDHIQYLGYEIGQLLFP